MKSFINAKGELEQHPENLEDQLALASPELSAKVDAIKDWKANLVLYRDFLYIFPNDDEIKLPVGDRTRINGCIEYAHNQKDLRGIIKTLEFMKHSDRRLIGDKVMILHSDRPLWDSVVEPVNGYVGKGWIGTLKDYAIIDPLNPAYETGQDKILRQVELSDAVELSPEDIGRWVSEKITNIIFHDFTDGLYAAIDRFDKMRLGKETVKITDRYENLDYVVIRHKNTPEEEIAATLPRVWRFDVTDYFPPIGDETDRFPTNRWFEDPDYREYMRAFEPSTARWYGKGDSKCLSAFIGKDPRAILEICEDLCEKLGKKEGLQIFVGKQLKSKLTAEQEDFINSQPAYDKDAWRNKFFTEKGLSLNDMTGINIFFYGNHVNKEEKYQNILTQARSILEPKGYVFDGTLSYGTWGRHDSKYVDFSDIARNGCYIGYSRGL